MGASNRWKAIRGGRRRAFLAVGLGSLVGCSGNGPTSIGTTYEVKGQILLQDGTPLTHGRVAIVPTEAGTVPASGEIGADGRFSLTTKSTDDGALPGEYKLRIEPAQSDPQQAAQPPYPLKYIDEDSSGVVITVKAEPNQLDPIRLK